LRRVPDELLERFLRCDGSADWLAFSRTYGPLGVFETADGGIGPAVDCLGQEEHQEPITYWKRYQAEFSGLLAASALLHEGRDIDRHSLQRLADIDVIAWPLRGFFDTSIWRAQGTRRPPVNWGDKSKSIRQLLEESTLEYSNPLLGNYDAYTTAERRAAVARAVAARISAHMRAYGLSPTLRFHTTRSAAQVQLVMQDLIASKGIAAISLLGALCLQMFAAAATCNLAICSGCGKLFLPVGRKPAAGRRAFCPSQCGKRVRELQAKADYRARERAKRVNRSSRRRRSAAEKRSE